MLCLQPPARCRAVLPGAPPPRILRCWRRLSRGATSVWLPMRILVVSTLYPPVAVGGYEVECSAVVERLRTRHEVLVLTSERDAGAVPARCGVRRELSLLSHDARGALRAPAAAVGGVRIAQRALAWKPDLVYVWNGSAIPHAALRVLADSGAPIAFRVCEHWFGGLFRDDQFMRELSPREAGPARAVWSLGCRTLNAHPALRLDPLAPLRAAISWNSEAIRRLVEMPGFVDPVLERVCHSVPCYGDVYARAARSPAPGSGREIVFVGRVTPVKGPRIAIEALDLLRSKHCIAARLVVIGPEDKGYGRALRRVAEHLGLSEAIEWRGQLAPEQIAAALSQAHAMIVPSDWQEPFPLVTIEGALARVPLVAADVGGIGEGMHHEEHALLFSRGDAAGAAVALACTLTDGARTDARVARARARAESFRLGPYLDAQERFVADAHAALSL